MRRRHLDNTTFLVYPKCVILKRMNNSAQIALREKHFTQVGVLWRPSFLPKALRLPKKLDLRRTPLQKSVAMLAAMSFFHPCTKFLHQRTLDCSVTTTKQECHSRPIKFHNSPGIHDRWTPPP